MLVDYHLHTVFSRHATGSIEDYLDRARRLGIEEVCFTEHTSRQYLPEEFCHQIPYAWMQEDELSIYLDQLAAAAKKTSIRIKRGLEVDYFAGYEESLGDFLDSLPLDFALGTVHFLPMYQMQYVSLIEAEPTTLLLQYLDYTKQAIESGLFDSLAHIHLGWQAVPWPKGEDGKAAADALGEVVAAALRQDMCLEMNTRAFNFEGYGTPQAYGRFLQMIADYGVPVTLGSDAHDPKEVGRNYPEVLRTLKHYGILEVATFERRKRQMVPVSDILLTAAGNR